MPMSCKTTATVLALGLLCGTASQASAETRGISIRLDRLVDNAAGNCATTLFVANALVQYESAP